MSNIAEQKALEAYPQKYDNLLDTNVHRRIGYRQGYEQAMQDFLERACEWLKDLDRRHVVRDFHTGEYYSVQDMIKDFKNFIENEM